MSRDVVTVTPDTSHIEAMNLMEKHGIRKLPVMQDGKLVGIVVEDDLLSAQPSPATMLSVHEVRALLGRLSMRRIMVTPVLTVAPDCPVEEAAELMLEHGLNCLPVVHNDALIGLITDTDLFRVLVEALGGEYEGVRITIHVPNGPGVIAEIARAIADVGGNITGLGSWEHNSVTVKVENVPVDTLKEALRKSNYEVIDIRFSGTCHAAWIGEEKKRLEKLAV
jgi:acetoin utilization protein AcuB